MAAVRELLKEGKDVPLTVTGNSMSPFLVHGRDQILISRIERPLHKGDMAFFCRKNGQYIMHRICNIQKGKCEKENRYYFIGDAQTMIEGPVEQDQIFGLITAVQRKGKTLKKGNYLWEFFEHIWLRIIPLRPVLCSIYTFFKRLKTR